MTRPTDKTPRQTTEPAPRGEPETAPVVIELALNGPEPHPPLSGWVEPALASIVRLAGVDRGAISLAVVRDDEMADLHQRYLGRDDTTDVLTFDLSDGPTTHAPTTAPTTGPTGPIGDATPRGRRPVDGEVVICIDEAARQAAAHGHDTRDEVLLYAVHGLLHLLGYDDHDDKQASLMHEREDQLLTAAGFGPIYRGRRPAHPHTIGG